MKSNFFVLAIIGSLLFMSCSDGTKSEKADESSAAMPGTPAAAGVAEAADALADISGTYTGILPCADCEGLKTTIILNSDKSYEIDEEYLGKKVTNKTNGRPWIVKDDIVTLDSMKNSKPVKYKIEDNSIVQLDANGNKMTGPMADKYILKKQ